MKADHIYLRTWGSLACFTRPEMKVERVSYPVITPSATRGILEAILYKPEFRWRIHRIAVKRPIQFLAFRRNEVKSRLSVRNPEPLNVEDDRTQRNTLALRDVEYVIEASIEISTNNQDRRRGPSEDEPKGENNLRKYYGMFTRRAEKGQCFTQPCFGCREFPAHFELTNESEMKVLKGIHSEKEDGMNLGLMLYDVFNLDVPYGGQKTETMQPKVTFFHASLKNGVMSIPSWNEVKKQFGGSI